MSLSQVLWSLDKKQMLPADHLSNEQELEEVLMKNMELLNPNWLVIGRQVHTPNGKFLDLLCIDCDENLIVVELKKELTPREVTAQVIEYASYIAEMDASTLAKIYLDYDSKYLFKKRTLDEAYHQKFKTDFDESQITQDRPVKMVIVATKMDHGTEHIIRYLRSQYSVDINILFFQVFRHGNDRILSRAWFEDDLELELSPSKSSEWNGEYYVSFGLGNRSWTDACKYGFISAGGGSWYSKTLGMLQKGDRVWVNIPHCGYVGVGYVTGEMQQASSAVLTVNGESVSMSSLQLEGHYFHSPEDPSTAEYIVPVDWIKTVSQTKAVKEAGFFGNQNSICRPKTPKWDFTIERLKTLWNIS